MEFREITIEEFRKFLNTHPLKTFIQTPEMANIRKHFGYQPFYVGVIKNSKVVAATMMGSRKTHFGFYEFYAPRGLLIDYENKELLSFFTEEIKKFIKKRHGYVLRIDPYYITKELDIDGNVVKDGIDHSLGIQNLKEVGFKKAATIYQKFKLMFSLNLNSSSEDLYKSFHTLPKRMIKKANDNEIVIREALESELSVVSNLIEETGERKHFSSRDLSYYNLLYKEFHPKKEVKFMIGEINVLKYKEKHTKIIEEIKQQLGVTSKNKKRDELQNKLQKEIELLQHINELNTNNENKIVVSAGVFLLYGDELIYLFGGNKKEFMSYGASYLMQWNMIQYGVSHKFKKYNFYGISSPTKIDGVYNFKRGFGGYVEELIGDFELPISMYYYIQKLLHFYRRK